MNNLILVDLNLDKSKYNYISETLLKNIDNSIKNNKKTLIYINKRWAFDFVLCQDCNYLYKCPRCDISLSVHKNPMKLLCHHCFYEQNYPHSCKKCSWTNLKNIWIWTQEIQETLNKIFPWKNIFRMDSDSISNIKEKKESIKNMSKADIIIWTKMITTWFDFKDIETIGVILLEQELQSSFYDIEEKVFFNIKQLFGRGSRAWQETNIIIQSFISNEDIVKNIVFWNYKEFFKKTLLERNIFKYPPYTNIAYIKYKSENKEKTIDFINNFFLKLEEKNKEKKYEIIKADSVYKRDNNFYSQIIIKWNNVNDLLDYFKNDIFKNKDLVINLVW